jgi:hypothetical protein
MDNPSKTQRDPITTKAFGGSTSPKRSDTLNGSPKTKSLGSQKANFSSVSPKDNSAPPPNNPYR